MWYPWTLKWEKLHRYPAGTECILTRPAEGILTPGVSTDAGVEGGPNRVFIGGCPVPVLVLYRDATTPIQCDDRMKAHLRFGHYMVPYLAQLVASRVDTDRKLDARSLKACDNT